MFCQFDTNLVRLWFLLDLSIREHNLMEKFEQNRKKNLVRLCKLIATNFFEIFENFNIRLCDAH